MKKQVKWAIFSVCFIVVVILGLVINKHAHKVINPIIAKYNIDNNIKLSCPFSIDLSNKTLDKNRFIAHAGGGIDGIAYTNSKEALLSSIENGYKFIEIDLLLSKDGVIYGAHDEETFNHRTGFKDLGDTKPYIKDVLQRTINDKYTTMDISYINEIFKSNKELILVTDKLNDFKAIKEQIPYLNRVIVEVFGIKNYNKALENGIKYPALSTKNFTLAIAKKIPIIVTNTKNLNDPLAKKYIQMGGCILAFSSNEKEFITQNLDSATMFYTDFWDIKNGECSLSDKTKCKTY